MVQYANENRGVEQSLRIFSGMKLTGEQLIRNQQAASTDTDSGLVPGKGEFSE
jgi:hypothetical protein